MKSAKFYSTAAGVLVPSQPSVQGLLENNNASSGFYLSRASNSLFNVSNPTKLTVRARFRPIQSNVNNGLVQRSALGSSQGDWALTIGDGTNMRPTWRVNGQTSSPGLITSPTNLTIGNWYFIEGSYDSSLASNNVKLFVNGVLKIQSTYTTAITNNAVALVVGTYYQASSFNMLGQLSEVEVCANFIRNTADYTPPSKMVADSNTTILWTFPSPGAGQDDGPNGLTPSANGTYGFGELSYYKVA